MHGPTALALAGVCLPHLLTGTNTIHHCQASGDVDRPAGATWVLPRPWAAELLHGVCWHGISAETVACGEGECGNRQTAREKDLRAQGRNAVLLACVRRFSRLRIQSGVDSPPLASEDCRMWYGHNWRSILGCCWWCFFYQETQYMARGIALQMLLVAVTVSLWFHIH
jgi:hypothetical protein